MNSSLNIVVIFHAKICINAQWTQCECILQCQWPCVFSNLSNATRPFILFEHVWRSARIANLHYLSLLAHQEVGPNSFIADLQAVTNVRDTLDKGRHHLQHTRIPCWVKREHHLHRFTWRVSECDKAIQYRIFVTHHLCDIICSIRVTLEPKKTIRKWRVKKQARTVFNFSSLLNENDNIPLSNPFGTVVYGPGHFFFYQQRQQATGIIWNSEHHAG